MPIPKDHDGLTIKQRRFAEALPIVRSATEAARIAGYSATAPNSLAQRGLENVRKREIMEAAQSYLQSAAEKLGLTPEYVLGGLMDNHKRAMQAIPVLNAKGKPTGEYTYQGQVANRALELLGKHLRILGDDQVKAGDTYNQVVLQGYTLEQLQAMLQSMQQGGVLPPSPPASGDETPTKET